MRTTPGALLLAAWLLAAAGCGDGPRGGGERDRDIRAQAERAEKSGELGEALGAYRDAAQRFPTAAWTWAGRGRVALALGRDREAEDSFREAVRWDSTRADAREALAGITWESGRADEALVWIDGALLLGSDGPGTRALRARILADAGRVGEAHKEIERALAADPADVDARIARAFLQLRSDSTTVALVTLDGLLLEHRDDARVLEARARIRLSSGNPRGAIADLERALELEPHRPRARLALARMLQKDERMDEAIEQYRSLLEDNPDHPEALAGLGACALARGDVEEAEAAYRRAIEFTPESATPYLALGRLLASQGRTDEAIALLRKARARASSEPELLVAASSELADIHLRLGEPDNALEVADALLARDPDSGPARALRARALAAGGGGASAPDQLESLATRPGATPGEVLAWGEWLFASGRADEAKAVADRVLARDATSTRARILHARALAASGSREAAEAELRALIGGADRTAEAHVALARLHLEAGRAQEALSCAREGAALWPNDPEFARTIGEASLALGDLDGAYAAFERERERRPESAMPWLHLGDVALRMGRPDGAAACFREARRIEPDDWTTSYLLGVAEDRAGRPAEAVAAYRTALAKNERVAEAHNNLAWLLADRDFDPSLAEAHARRAAELAPDDPNVLGTLGWAQYKTGLLDEAAVTLKKATRARPDDPMKQYMLGVVLRERGEREAARRAIETALQLDPGFERAGQAESLLDDLGG